MKINDLAVGQYIYTRNFGYGLIVAIGRYSVSFHQSPRVIKWRGRTIDVGTRWVEEDFNVKQRRVAVVDLHGRITVVSAAVISEILTDDRIHDMFVEEKASTEVAQSRELRREQHGSYLRSQQEIIAALAGPEHRDRYYGSNPKSLLIEAPVLDKMIVLYLTYLHQRGETVEGIEDMEAAVDSFKDAVRGLRSNAQGEDTDLTIARKNAMVEVDKTFHQSQMVIDVAAAA